MTRVLSAHHSYSAYETDRIVEVQGVLEDFEWIAPHSLIKIKDEEGRLYIFEWQAPFSLQRRGIQQDTLENGDHLVLTGSRTAASRRTGFSTSRL
jgi:hypothetical protein